MKLRKMADLELDCSKQQDSSDGLSEIHTYIHTYLLTYSMEQSPS